ncbi:MAG: hypothetical protein H6662_20270 [Ardenticatenaceae bacterium]|nr:hypothetical protein [Anaerolineales bacterium]MCB8923922.1 hypothetical protein [Ardenticatenaceae bacterium]MCB9004385.1 hypothetical protein [Ardenticatenaceae bacterium]
MEVLQRKSVIAIVAVILGFVLGLVWGWFIDPVEWSGAGLQDMAEADQARYLGLVADTFAQEGNVQKVQDALAGWSQVDQRICQVRSQSLDAIEQDRLNAIAAVMNGQGCTAVAAPTEQPAEEGGGGLGTVLLLFALLIVIVFVILFILGRRNAAVSQQPTMQQSDEMPMAAPVVSEIDDGATAVPIARFSTTYTRGHDAYDDSFSIENAIGDFLGECGVGISESIGADSPKNVTAFEVWLFDKNDIRTITKVVMSDHAFFDDAIKAKLQTKGEQVLAREGETVVLETASLIINAEVTGMQYGSGTLPPKSYFETITFELSAWQKEGVVAPANEGVEDMMDF